jgi:5'-methylthioadenosine phosphorylase
MRAALLQAAASTGIRLRDGGVYAAVQGPRLETAAEINRMQRDGADMVGMTGMPEAYLARELDLCYAAVGAVLNRAAGRGPSADGIRMEEIQAVLGEVMQQVRHLLEQLVNNDAAGLCRF